MAHGYAARMIVNKEIQISTVSETRRGATVNGIVSLLGRYHMERPTLGRIL